MGRWLGRPRWLNAGDFAFIIAVLFFLGCMFYGLWKGTG